MDTYRLAVLALILWGTVASSLQLEPQVESRDIRGTVNVVLSNKNGLVVLTDSTGSLFQGDKRVGSVDSQKLIALDRQSVCAISGLGSGTVPTLIQFNVDVMALLSNYRDELAKNKGVLSFDEKLRSISFLIEHYITGYANIKEYTGPGTTKPGDLYFALFLVGYDADGKPKIGTLELTSNPIAGPDGNITWNVTPKIAIQPPAAPLDLRLGGMQDVGRQIAGNAQNYAKNPGIAHLMASTDKGASLSLSDLESIAKLISRRTHAKHPDDVGGADQIAILEKGKISGIQQQQFEARPTPIKFTLIMGVPLGFGPGGSFSFGKDIHTIWIRNQITGYQRLQLDGNFFLGNDIRDSYLIWAGGPTVFDKSNRVTNSQLEIHPPIGPFTETTYSLVNEHEWTKCIPIPCSAFSRKPQ